jgi:hypothetical protein
VESAQRGPTSQIEGCFQHLAYSKSPNRQHQVNMFTTFYLPISYSGSIRFLNMSWSTVHGEHNESSVITFGVYLDLQNQLLKQHVCNFVAPMTLRLACRVLQKLLSNLSRSKCKSWSLHDGEEHTRRWHQLHFMLTLNLDIFSLLLFRGHYKLWSQLPPNPGP